jgi:ABC-type multidrug transport system ATPase subunit
VGYVPQEDVFDRDLTVRELFTFNAMTRLYGRRTEAEIKVIVDDILAELSMQHVADSIIGGGGENKAANISGGQLKRVNIGCELVSLQRPGILLLDEPTNGLDASVAYELMETLEVVRDRGITIVMVIQQPRAEIFAKIQHLFLMNSCGGIVYEGSSGGAVPYLRSIGYNVGEETSDADFCVDVLNGLNDVVVESVDGDEQEKKILDANKLHLIWSDPDNRSSNVVSSRNESALEAGDSSVMESVQYRNSDSPFFQSALSTLQKEAYFTYLNSKRLLRVRLRDQFGIVLYVIINAVMASALSSGFSILITGNYLKVFTPSTNQQFYDFFPRVVGKWNERPQMVMSISQLLFFLSSALGAGSCLASVPVFAGKAIILARETSGGMSVLAYSLGRILADLFFVIFNAFVFAGIW